MMFMMDMMTWIAANVRFKYASGFRPATLRHLLLYLPRAKKKHAIATGRQNMILRYTRNLPHLQKHLRAALHG